MYVLTTKTEYGTKRSSKLGLDDFLVLLAEFNAKNIHFRWLFDSVDSVDNVDYALYNYL